MNNIFNKYMDKFVLVFIDGILVYSKSKEEHEEHLRIVLWVVREHQLYAKFSKCDFYKPQIRYLGHIISETGIAMDPKKIKAIKDWPTPTSVTDIRSFLRLAVLEYNPSGLYVSVHNRNMNSYIGRWKGWSEDESQPP